MSLGGVATDGSAPYEVLVLLRLCLGLCHNRKLQFVVEHVLSIHKNNKLHNQQIRKKYVLKYVQKLCMNMTKNSQVIILR